MNKLAAVLKLTRIEHSLMLVIAVLAAELLAGGLPQMSVLLLSLISPVFISMASFAVNDYFDIKVDKLNRKNRPLVTGELKPADAVYVATVSFAIGVLASASINAYAFAIALIFAILAVLYSYKLKEMLVVGNLYVALTMLIPFLFGNYVVSGALRGSILLISVMVFFSGFAREIHGTIRDYRGDVKMRRATTLPRAIGVENAALDALLFYLAAVAISIFLFFFVAPFANNPLFGAMIGVSDMMLLYVGLGYVYKKKRAQQFYERTRNVSLLAMGLALVAILISAAVYI